MKRNHNLRRLRAKKSYSAQELASALQIHVQTVRHWRKDGLCPIDSSVSRVFYLGSTVQAYLRQQRQKRRVKLREGEFYCFCCKRGTTSLQTKTVSQNKFIGKGDESIRLEGVCVRCGKKVNRFGVHRRKALAGAKDTNTGLSSSLYRSLN